MGNAELRNRADELNQRQADILDRFPVLMGLDDEDRNPIVDELIATAEQGACDIVYDGDGLNVYRTLCGGILPVPRHDADGYEAYDFCPYCGGELSNG